MLLRLIACNVFQREACLCLAQSPHVIDAEFTEIGEHVHSATLREQLQRRITAAEESPKKYDAILLLFGLCGNSTVGLRTSHTPLVMPRAHDCCTILLGSRERFREHFGANPSTPFSSVGYFERGEYFLRTVDDRTELTYEDPYKAYVEQYGEENAKYIWEAMHPEGLGEAEAKVVFIGHPETAHLGAEARFRGKAEAEGKVCVTLEGSLRLIRALVNGEWNPDEFLVVSPGETTVGVYDWSEIVRAKPA